jgi:hypothetical protein
MAKIKIKDLPKNKKISLEEMKQVVGGFDLSGGLPMGSSLTPMTSLSPEQLAELQANALAMYHDTAMSIIRNIR